MTFNLVTTYSQSPPAGAPSSVWTNSTTGTISDHTGILYTFNFSTSATNAGSGGGFDPINNPLTFDVGMLNSDNDGILASGANFVFSNISVVAGAVPEPSSYALLCLGLAGMFLIGRMRRRSV